MAVRSHNLLGSNDRVYRFVKDPVNSGQVLPFYGGVNYIGHFANGDNVFVVPVESTVSGVTSRSLRFFTGNDSTIGHWVDTNSYNTLFAANGPSSSEVYGNYSSRLAQNDVDDVYPEFHVVAYHVDGVSPWDGEIRQMFFFLDAGGSVVWGGYDTRSMASNFSLKEPYEITAPFPVPAAADQVSSNLGAPWVFFNRGSSVPVSWVGLFFDGTQAGTLDLGSNPNAPQHIVTDFSHRGDGVFWDHQSERVWWAGAAGYYNNPYTVPEGAFTPSYRIDFRRLVLSDNVISQDVFTVYPRSYMSDLGAGYTAGVVRGFDFVNDGSRRIYVGFQYETESASNDNYIGLYRRDANNLTSSLVGRVRVPAGVKFDQVKLSYTGYRGAHEIVVTGFRKAVIASGTFVGRPVIYQTTFDIDGASFSGWELADTESWRRSGQSASDVPGPMLWYTKYPYGGHVHLGVERVAAGGTPTSYDTEAFYVYSYTANVPPRPGITRPVSGTVVDVSSNLEMGLAAFDPNLEDRVTVYRLQRVINTVTEYWTGSGWSTSSTYIDANTVGLSVSLSLANWNPASNANTLYPHHYTLQVSDGTVLADSAPVTVQPTIPPTVTITAPSNNASISTGQITVSWTQSRQARYQVTVTRDSGQIVHVSAITTGNGTSYSFDTPGPGTFEISVEVFNSHGFAVSATVDFSVPEPTLMFSTTEVSVNETEKANDIVVLNYQATGEGEGTIDAYVSSPDTEFPSRYDLYRHDISDPANTHTRLLKDVTPIYPRNPSYRDYEIVSGKKYNYWARGYDQQGVYRDGPLSNWPAYLWEPSPLNDYSAITDGNIAVYDVNCLDSVWANPEKTIPAVLNGQVAVVEDLTGWRGPNGETHDLEFFSVVQYEGDATPSYIPRLRLSGFDNHYYIDSYYGGHMKSQMTVSGATGLNGGLYGILFGRLNIVNQTSVIATSTIPFYGSSYSGMSIVSEKYTGSIQGEPSASRLRFNTYHDSSTALTRSEELSGNIVRHNVVYFRLGKRLVYSNQPINSTNRPNEQYSSLSTTDYTYALNVAAPNGVWVMLYSNLMYYPSHPDLQHFNNASTQFKGGLVTSRPISQLAYDWVISSFSGTLVQGDSNTQYGNRVYLPGEVSLPVS